MTTLFCVLQVLLSEFEEIVGTSHPFYAQLLRIYKKKIKRSKLHDKNKGGDSKKEEEESSSDDDSDLDDLGDDFGDEDEEEEEVCPDGCEKMTYERVLALRERRLDIDDVAQEVRCSLPVLEHCIHAFIHSILCAGGDADQQEHG